MYSKDELVELIVNNPLEYASYKAGLDCQLDLSESDFSNVTLESMDFSNCDLSGSSFIDAHLAIINFSGSDLKSTDFTRSKVLESDFSDCLLNGADFTISVVDYCNFAGADMAGAVFIEADLANSDFTASEHLEACRFDETTIWPEPELLPEDFDTSYSNDLSLLKDEEETEVEDY